MSTRTKEELSGVSLLGNQGTKYPQDYAFAVYKYISGFSFPEDNSSQFFFCIPVLTKTHGHRLRRSCSFPVQTFTGDTARCVCFPAF